MVVTSGKSVLQGIAYGKIHLYHKKDFGVVQKKIRNVDAEIRRMEEAFGLADKQLKMLYQKALNVVGDEQATIFEGHRAILADEDYQSAVREMIKKESVNAEYAVHVTGEKFYGILSSVTDVYMKERSEDVKDVSARLERILAGVSSYIWDAEEPMILLADDLSPSEIVQLDKNKIRALVLRQGSVNSHTAILARSLSLPALVQTDIELKEEYNGKMAIVDGTRSVVFIDPHAEVLEILRKEKEEMDKKSEELDGMRGLENVTSDGRHIHICANIEDAEDVDKVWKADASGIGLFRSEFMYMGREDYPSEEEQFEVYKNVLSKMEGKKVVIRTLDVGADKQIDYFHLPEEKNPAMGYRGIRICLDRIDIFKTQLRAIYRASVYGTAAVMFPMITSVKEIKKIKEIIEEIKAQLNASDIPFGDVRLGIMIETPAAAVISDLLAKEVDFLSLGTNDLTQYTLAIDRQNPCLERFFDPHHEAVLRLIQMTVENGHKEGIQVGICGELGADTELIKTFLDIGIDEVSVSPASVLRVRKAVRSI